jgi:hypothetical protein
VFLLPLLLERRPWPVGFPLDEGSLLGSSAEPPHVADSKPKPPCDISSGGSLLLFALTLLRISFLQISELLLEASAGPPRVTSAKASPVFRVRPSLFLVLVVAPLVLICFVEESDFLVDASGQPCEELVDEGLKS